MKTNWLTTHNLMRDFLAAGTVGIALVAAPCGLVHDRNIKAAQLKELNGLYQNDVDRHPFREIYLPSPRDDNDRVLLTGRRYHGSYGTYHVLKQVVPASMATPCRSVETHGQKTLFSPRGIRTLAFCPNS